MNKKQKVIESIKELIKRYEAVVLIPGCPLCDIYRGQPVNGRYLNNCYGCPSATKGGNIGCAGAITFYRMTTKRPETYKKRADFWRLRLPVLKDMPSSWFEPSKKHWFDIDNEELWQSKYEELLQDMIEATGNFEYEINEKQIDPEERSVFRNYNI